MCSVSLAIVKVISGMRQMSTTPDAMLACIAMKPDERPIRFTSPTPLQRHSRTGNLFAQPE